MTPGLMFDSYQGNDILAFHDARIILNKICRGIRTPYKNISGCYLILTEP